MINTTDALIPLIAGKSLDSAIRSALSWSEQVVHAQLLNTNERQHRFNVMPRFFGVQNRGEQAFDEQFLQAALHFCSSDSTNTGTAPSMTEMAEYLRARTVAASNYPILKRGIRLLLVRLWSHQAILLPTLFMAGPHFAMGSFEHELLAWLRAFDPEDRSGKGKQDYRRIFEYGPRLLWTTDWKRPEDVSLDEVAELHRARLLYAQGLHPHAITSCPLPWSQFPVELLRSFPDRVQFSAADIGRYSSWAANAVAHGELSEFAPEPKATKTTKPAREVRTSTRGEQQVQDDLRSRVQAAKTHDAVLVLFKRVAQKRPPCADWQSGSPLYPGREHVDLGAAASNWTESFKAFLHHRTHVQGYRAEDNVLSTLNILADYLFLYLPWWKELHPNGAVDVPASPREFKRFAYVSRTSAQPLEALPATLLELVELRRPAVTSRAPCIRHLTLYFRFVAAHYGEDEAMAGPRFSNPLDDEFDAPRVPRKSKTNKEIIPRNIYGYLLFFCYAVEKFGEHLLQQALKGAFEGKRGAMRDARQFETQSFGLVPVVRYRGSEFPLQFAPNVFTWAEREIESGDRISAISVPHLSALRLLIASLETGLRCQSVQWLDIRTWDSCNNDEKKYIYRLLVNTDKTKVEPWSPPIVFRVRDLLRRETIFQNLFVDAEAFEPVPYEGLDSAPFDPIRPLFRAPTIGRPVSDNAYAKTWVSLLVEFESFYKSITGERHIRLYYVKGKTTADGQPAIAFTDRESLPFCPLSLLAVHTPHSCRATFATNRQGQGILELSDVAELLGHGDVVVTSVYTKFSGEQLEERLMKSDQTLLGGFNAFEDDHGGVYVRPDKPDSALVRGFVKDRHATVQRFGFMPALAIWSIDDDKLEDHDGLELLKAGPMSHIRFRETHICPVGEECPADIVRLLGAHRRCGLCPLAMKCVDHLPAISAKRNQLTERILFLETTRNRMEAAREPVASMDAVWEEMERDVNELLGWKFSEEILLEILRRVKDVSSDTYPIHVERPDIVRRHLTKVTRDCDRSEFLLRRIGESNAYPSMTSPQVQVAATTLRRQLLSGQKIDGLAVPSQGDDDVRAVAKLLGTLIKSKQLPADVFVSLMESPVDDWNGKPLLLAEGAFRP